MASWWRNPYPWIVGALLLLAALLTVPAPLANDIRYEAGSHATYLGSVAGTFSHRPLMHRFLTAAVFAPAWAISGGDRVGFEQVVRVEAIVVAVLACLSLWFGLRRYVPRLASPITVAALAGLLLCSTGIAWEPDWLAVVITIAGIGAGLGRRPVGPVVAGVLFALAAVIKFVTLPIALIGLLALVVLEMALVAGGRERRPFWQRRYVIATVSATIAGVVWLVLLFTVWPFEVQWLLDASQMQPRRSLYDNATITPELLGNAMMLWPAVALIPASLVRSTLPEKLLVIGGLALAWIPVVGQQQYFPYHLAVFPVMGSIALVMGLRRGGRWLAGYALAGALASLIPLVVLDAPTRVAWMVPLSLVWLAYAVIGVIVQRRRIHAFTEPATRRLGALAAVVTVVTLVPVSLPAAVWSVTINPSRYFSTDFSLAENRGLLSSGERIRAEIGADTPVVYLAFGDQVYAVGNPTHCPYPTGVFVQRGEWEKPILTTRTYADNLACLDDPRARYLVWDKNYLTEQRQPPEVIARIERNFDCDDAPVYNVLTVCPRR